MTVKLRAKTVKYLRNLKTSRDFFNVLQKQKKRRLHGDFLQYKIKLQWTLSTSKRPLWRNVFTSALVHKVFIKNDNDKCYCKQYFDHRSAIG